jgi:hypothetical protein
MADLTSLFADISAELPNELIQPLLSTPGIRIERIISLGHASLRDSGTIRRHLNGCCS